MTKRLYNDFLEDAKIPIDDRFYCVRCERWIPKANSVHTCIDVMYKRILSIIEHLHAFQKLHKREIIMLSEVFDRDVAKIASENGVTYEC